MNLFEAVSRGDLETLESLLSGDRCTLRPRRPPIPESTELNLEYVHCFYHCIIFPAGAGGENNASRVRDSEGNTPLLRACERGDKKIVRALLRAGCSLSDQVNNLHDSATNEQLHLHQSISLCSLAVVKVAPPHLSASPHACRAACGRIVNDRVTQSSSISL
jgi:ankyrin repeat protein